MIYVALTIGMLIGMRFAYGCWPWEWYKTWHATKGEIKFLRDVQENQRDKGRVYGNVSP